MKNNASKNKNIQLFIAILIIVAYYFILVHPLMPKNENSTFKGPDVYFHTITIVPYFIFLVYFIAIFKHIKQIRCILFPICALILYLGAAFVLPGGGAAIWLIVFTILPFLGILLIIFIASLGFDIMERENGGKNNQKPITYRNVTQTRRIGDSNNLSIKYTKTVKVPVTSKICPFCGEVIPKNSEGCLRGCEVANKDILKYVDNISLSDELKKFNWGAFLLSWIWGIGNNVPVALFGLIMPILALIPGVGVLVMPFYIWLGIKGNELAWASGKYTNIRKFRAVQQKWALWGWAFDIIMGILLIIIFFLSITSRPGRF